MTTLHSPEPLPAGFVRRRADVNGTSLSFLMGGEGPVLVLLHGWPETATSWRHLLGPLAEAGFTVVAPDLRGTGQSERAQSGYAKDNQAEDVRALLRHLSLPTSARVVGHDIGGMVAFAWARRHPEEVRRLVLAELAVPGFGLEEAMEVSRGGRWHFGLFMTPEVPELLFLGHEREFFGWWFAHLPADGRAFPSDLLDRMAAQYTGLEALRCGFAHDRTLLDDGRVNQAWGEAGGRLDLPVMAVGGAFAVRSRLADSLRPIAPDLVDVVTEDSGHFVAEEQPHELLRRLVSFLS